MKNQELIERLEQIEAVMIPPCFKADMEAVKGQMLELLDKMTLNTMTTADTVAVLEVFLSYLRNEERQEEHNCIYCKYLLADGKPCIDCTDDNDMFEPKEEEKS